VTAEVILSSPLRRAVETARLAAEALGVAETAVRLTTRLNPSADADGLLAEVRSLSPRPTLCVGHAPHLDAVLAHALAHGSIPFTRLKKSGAACLQLADSPDDPTAELLWMLDPRTLRRLRRVG
jgi:phosphohistidine phosphatase SixA